MDLGSNQRMVYFIQQTVKSSSGGFIPCIAIEGESGYYPTDWDWGTDLELAEECAREKNERLGITEDEAHKIILGTMFRGGKK